MLWGKQRMDRYIYIKQFNDNEFIYSVFYDCDFYVRNL